MNRIFKKLICGTVAVTFTLLTVFPSPAIAQQMFSLPAPGMMITPSPPFAPVILRGIKIHPDNPFEFEFLVDSGDAKLKEEQFKEESTKLVKYFLASLTVPEEDLWVNLSPYEKDRIIPNEFGTTEMGRDLLAQDYLLKQLTASLIYPETDLGRKFWERVYKRAHELYGTTDIAISTFNKVWILPDKAVVNEVGDTAFVAESHLKVMLEEDYAAAQKAYHPRGDNNTPGVGKEVNKLSSQIIKDLIVPEIEKEVNSGKNFAQLRQVYNSLILAAWYKRALKESILSQVYADKNKVTGVDLEDKTQKEKIYQQYLEAYKKGVYNFIKEEYDPASEEMKPRKYFSGGFQFGAAMNRAMTVEKVSRNKAMLSLGKVAVGALLSILVNFTSAQDPIPPPKVTPPVQTAEDLKTPEGVEKYIQSVLENMKLMNEFDDKVFISALAELGIRAIPSLIKALKDPGQRPDDLVVIIRAIVSIALFSLDDIILEKQVVPALQEVLKRGGPVNVLYAATDELVRITHNEAWLKKPIILFLLDAAQADAAKGKSSLGNVSPRRSVKRAGNPPLSVSEALDRLTGRAEAASQARIAMRQYCISSLGKINFSGLPSTILLDEVIPPVLDFMKDKDLQADAASTLVDAILHPFFKKNTDPASEAKVLAALRTSILPVLFEYLKTESRLAQQENILDYLSELVEKKDSLREFLLLQVFDIAKKNKEVSREFIALGTMIGSYVYLPDDPMLFSLISYLQTPEGSKNPYALLGLGKALFSRVDNTKFPPFLKPENVTTIVAIYDQYFQDPKNIELVSSAETALEDKTLMEKIATAFHGMATFLPNDHPQKDFFFSISQRHNELESGAVVYSDIKAVQQIFSANDELRKQTETMLPGKRFSIARAVVNILQRFGLAVDEGRVARLTPLMIKTLDEYASRPVLDANTNVVIPIHGENRFLESAKTFTEIAKGAGVESVRILRGKTEKEKILDAIVNAPAHMVLALFGHGGELHFWLEQGEVGSEKSTDLYLTIAISYEELAKALRKRAKRFKGDLSTDTISISSCYSGTCAVNALNALRPNFQAGEINKFPVIVTSSLGAVSYGKLNQEIAVVAAQKKGQSLTLGDIIEAGTQANVMEWEDPVSFLQVTPERWKEIRDAVGLPKDMILEVQIDPLKPILFFDLPIIVNAAMMSQGDFEGNLFRMLQGTGITASQLDKYVNDLDKRRQVDSLVDSIVVMAGKNGNKQFDKYTGAVIEALARVAERLGRQAQPSAPPRKNPAMMSEEIKHEIFRFALSVSFDIPTAQKANQFFTDLMGKQRLSAKEWESAYKEFHKIVGDTSPEVVVAGKYRTETTPEEVREDSLRKKPDIHPVTLKNRMDQAGKILSATMKVAPVFKSLAQGRLRQEMKTDPIGVAADVFVELVERQPFINGNHHAAALVSNRVLAEAKLPLLVITDTNNKEYAEIIDAPQDPKDRWHKQRKARFRAFLAKQVVPLGDKGSRAMMGETEIPKNRRTLNRAMLVDPKIAEPIDAVPANSEKIERGVKVLYMSPKALAEMEKLDRFAADTGTEVVGFGLTQRLSGDSTGATSVLVDFILPREDKVFVIRELTNYDDSDQFYEALAESQTLELTLQNGNIFFKSSDPQLSFILKKDSTWEYLHKIIQRLTLEVLPSSMEDLKTVLREKGNIALNTDWDVVLTGRSSRTTEHYFNLVRAKAQAKHALPDFTMHHHPPGLLKDTMRGMSVAKRERMYQSPLLRVSLMDVRYMENYDVGWFEIRALGTAEDLDSTTETTQRIYHMDEIITSKMFIAQAIQALIDLPEAEITPEKIFALNSQLILLLRAAEGSPETMLHYALGKKVFNELRKKYRMSSVKNIRDFSIHQLLADDDPLPSIHAMSLDLLKVHAESGSFRLSAEVEAVYKDSDDTQRLLFNSIGYRSLIFETNVDKFKQNIQIFKLLLSNPREAWQQFMKRELLDLGFPADEIDSFLEENSMEEVKETVRRLVDQGELEQARTGVRTIMRLTNIISFASIATPQEAKAMWAILELNLIQLVKNGFSDQENDATYRELGRVLREAWRSRGLDPVLGRLNQHLALLSTLSGLQGEALERLQHRVDMLTQADREDRLVALWAQGASLVSHLRTFGMHAERGTTGAIKFFDNEKLITVVREYIGLLLQRPILEAQQDRPLVESGYQGAALDVTQRDILLFGLVMMLDPTVHAYDHDRAYVNQGQGEFIDATEFVEKTWGDKKSMARDYLKRMLEGIKVTDAQGQESVVSNEQIDQLLAEAFGLFVGADKKIDLRSPLEAFTTEHSLREAVQAAQKGKGTEYPLADPVFWIALTEKRVQALFSPAAQRVFFPEIQPMSSGIFDGYAVFVQEPLRTQFPQLQKVLPNRAMMGRDVQAAQKILRTSLDRNYLFDRPLREDMLEELRRYKNSFPFVPDLEKMLSVNGDMTFFAEIFLPFLRQRAARVNKSMPDYEAWLENDSSEKFYVQRALANSTGFFNMKTMFFRNIQDWEIETFLPELIQQKWQANDLTISSRHVSASVGVEPYSIAIAIHYFLQKFHDQLRQSGPAEEPFEVWLNRWQINIDAFDISSPGLFAAQQGTYRLTPEMMLQFNAAAEVQRIFPGFAMEKYFRPAAGGYQVMDKLRSWIRPVYIDLNEQDQIGLIADAQYDISFSMNTFMHAAARLPGGERPETQTMNFLVNPGNIQYPSLLVYTEGSGDSRPAPPLSVRLVPGARYVLSEKMKARREQRSPFHAALNEALDRMDHPAGDGEKRDGSRAMMVDSDADLEKRLLKISRDQLLAYDELLDQRRTPRVRNDTWRLIAAYVLRDEDEDILKGREDALWLAHRSEGLVDDFLLKLAKDQDQAMKEQIKGLIWKAWGNLRSKKDMKRNREFLKILDDLKAYAVKINFSSPSRAMMGEGFRIFIPPQELAEYLSALQKDAEYFAKKRGLDPKRIRFKGLRRVAKVALRKQEDVTEAGRRLGRIFNDQFNYAIVHYDKIDAPPDWQALANSGPSSRVKIKPASKEAFVDVALGWIKERFGKVVPRDQVILSFNLSEHSHFTSIFDKVVYRIRIGISYLSLYHELVHLTSGGFDVAWMDEAATEKLVQDLYDELGGDVVGETREYPYPDEGKLLKKIADVIGWQPIMLSYLTGDEQYYKEALGLNGVRAFELLEVIESLFDKGKDEILDAILANLNSEEKLLELAQFLITERNKIESGKWYVVDKEKAMAWLKKLGSGQPASAKIAQYSLTPETYSKLQKLSEDKSNPTLQKNAIEMLAISVPASSSSRAMMANTTGEKRSKISPEFERQARIALLQEGPMPVTAFPDPTRVQEVGQRFLVEEPVNDNDLELLIKQAVAEVRQAMIDESKRVSPWDFTDKHLYLLGKNCDGKCGESGFEANTRLVSFSEGQIESFWINTIFFQSSVNSHHATVVRLKDGEKAFLVDTSLRQFFIARSNGLMAEVGTSFMNTAPDVANKLLRDGYIELTNEVLSIYGNAFRAVEGLPAAEFTLNDIWSMDKIRIGTVSMDSEKEEQELFEPYGILVKERRENYRRQLGRAAAESSGAPASKAMMGMTDDSTDGIRQELIRERLKVELDRRMGGIFARLMSKLSLGNPLRSVAVQWVDTILAMTSSPDRAAMLDFIRNFPVSSTAFVIDPTDAILGEAALYLYQLEQVGGRRNLLRGALSSAGLSVLSPLDKVGTAKTFFMGVAKVIDQAREFSPEYTLGNHIGLLQFISETDAKASWQGADDERERISAFEDLALLKGHYLDMIRLASFGGKVLYRELTAEQKRKLESGAHGFDHTTRVVREEADALPSNIVRSMRGIQDKQRRLNLWKEFLSGDKGRTTKLQEDLDQLLAKLADLQQELKQSPELLEMHLQGSYYNKVAVEWLKQYEREQKKEMVLLEKEIAVVEAEAQALQTVIQELSKADKKSKAMMGGDLKALVERAHLKKISGTIGTAFRKIFELLDPENDQPYDLVLKVADSMGAGSGYYDRLEEALTIAKENMGGLMAPFSVLRDVARDGQKDPLDVVAKKYSILPADYARSSGFVLKDGRNINLKEKVRDLIVEAAKRGILINDFLTNDNLGVDLNSGEVVFIDSMNVQRVGVEDAFFAEVQGNQRRYTGTSSAWLDDIGVPSDEELKKLWGTEQGQRVDDAPLPANRAMMGDEEVYNKVKRGDIVFGNDLVAAKEYITSLIAKEPDQDVLTKLKIELERLDERARWGNYRLPRGKTFKSIIPVNGPAFDAIAPDDLVKVSYDSVNSQQNFSSRISIVCTKTDFMRFYDPKNFQLNQLVIYDMGWDRLGLLPSNVSTDTPQNSFVGKNVNISVIVDEDARVIELKKHIERILIEYFTEHNIPQGELTYYREFRDIFSSMSKDDAEELVTEVDHRLFDEGLIDGTVSYGYEPHYTFGELIDMIAEQVRPEAYDQAMMGGVGQNIPKDIYNGVSVISDRRLREIEDNSRRSHTIIGQMIPRWDKEGNKKARFSKSMELLPQIGQAAQIQGPVLYYPFGGFDSHTPFLLSANVTDVLSIGKNRFGSPQEVSAFFSNPPPEIGTSPAFSYAGYDDMDALRQYQIKYKLDGLGGLALLRIAGLLEGKIKGIHYFDLNSDGNVNFLEVGPEDLQKSPDTIARFNNAVIEFEDPKTGELKRFWYIQSDLTKDADSFDQFIGKLSFNSLLIKAPSTSFPVHLMEDAELMKRKIFDPAKRNKVVVVSDEKYSSSGEPRPQPIWKNNSNVKMIKLGPDQEFGYSEAQGYVFYGTAEDLIDLKNSDRAMMGNPLEMDTIDLQSLTNVLLHPVSVILVGVGMAIAWKVWQWKRFKDLREMTIWISKALEIDEHPEIYEYRNLAGGMIEQFNKERVTIIPRLRTMARSKIDENGENAIWYAAVDVLIALKATDSETQLLYDEYLEQLAAKGLDALYEKYVSKIYVLTGGRRPPAAAVPATSRAMMGALNPFSNLTFKINTYVMNNGARVLTRLSERQFDPDTLVDQDKIARKVWGTVISPLEGHGWDVWGTSLETIEHEYNWRLLEDIIERAKAQPERIISVLDWGMGPGKVLNQIAQQLRERGINNVRLIGLSDRYSPEWKNIDASITIIFDDARKLTRYLEAESIDLIYSYYGLIHFQGDLDKHLQELNRLMRDHGKIIFNSSPVQWDHFRLKGFDVKFGDRKDSVSLQKISVIPARAMMGEMEPQLNNDNVYSRILQGLVNGPNVTEESKKRRAVLRKIGPKLEKFIQKSHNNANIRIAIAPLGSTLKGYAAQDSDIEFQLIILQGLPQFDTTLSLEESAYIVLYANNLIKDEGFEGDGMTVLVTDVLNMSVASNLDLDTTALEYGLESDQEKITMKKLRGPTWGPVFLPMAYAGDMKLLERARKSVLLSFYKEEHRYLGIRNRFNAAIKIDEMFLAKPHLNEWLRKQNVSWEEFNERQVKQFGLPSFRDMMSIYVQQNKAMLAPQSSASEVKILDKPVGGIDFNPANLNLKINRDGKGMPIPFTPQELQQINIPGLVPIIINITPITNLPLFLGESVETDEPVEQLSMR